MQSYFLTVGLPPPPPPSSSSGAINSSTHCDMKIGPTGSTGILRSPRHQPKTLMVTSSSVTGENFHTFTDPDQYPDLLNMHPVNTKLISLSPGTQPKVGQPLNPAALVMPPTPPAQFPHQFQHLIHTNKSSPRTHSPQNGSNGGVMSPLLSPPAQFSSPKHEDLGVQKGYVTLPRKLTGSRGPIDWGVMTERPPIYDGVGPRTSATGTTLEVVNQLQPKRSSSLKRFPDSKSRESSGSEVTLGKYKFKTFSISELRQYKSDSTKPKKRLV